MKKNNRILKNSDFKRIIESGIKIYGHNFSVYYKINNNSYRIGITVSKKVSKLAVKRNLIKRRIVGILNEIKPCEIFNKDIVIIAKPSCIKLTYNELKKEIKNILVCIKRKEKNGKEK